MIELFNEAVYYKENHAYFYCPDCGLIIKRNTWTGKEKAIAGADNLKDAKKYIQAMQG